MINTLVIKPHIVLLIDGLSRQQVMELSDCFEQLPRKPHVTLVTLRSFLPERYYQLPEMLSVEKKAMEAAKKSLFEVEQIFGFSTVHRVIPRIHFTVWMRHWKQVGDTLVIGKKMRFQTNRFFKRTAFIVDINRWLTAFESLVVGI